MIILIDNYDSFTWNLYQQLAQFGAVKVYRNDQIQLKDIKALRPQAIVLSPGPGRPEDAGICIPLLYQFSGQIPILGVCLGHQALAIAFGGQVVRAPEIIHGKAVPVFHDRQGLYRSLPSPFMAGRYHSLVVDRQSLPNILSVEAETAEGMIMGMRHVLHPTFGVQFHPESLLTPEGNSLLEAFVGLSERYLIDF